MTRQAQSDSPLESVAPHRTFAMYRGFDHITRISAAQLDDGIHDTLVVGQHALSCWIHTWSTANLKYRKSLSIFCLPTTGASTQTRFERSNPKRRVGRKCLASLMSEKPIFLISIDRPCFFW